MSKERSAKVSLSKFFSKSIIAIKEKIYQEDFERCSPLTVLIYEKQCSNVCNKKKVKSKNTGPQFKGFCIKDIDYSGVYNIKFYTLLNKIERNILEYHEFLGFSTKEIKYSNERSKFYLEKLQCGINYNDNVFYGFSQCDADDSTILVSNVKTAYQSIKNCIYRNIDRRILNSHIKENKVQGIVCSKYWIDNENRFQINKVKRKSRTLRNRPKYKKTLVPVQKTLTSLLSDISKARNIDFQNLKCDVKNNGQNNEFRQDINLLKDQTSDQEFCNVDNTCMQMFPSDINISIEDSPFLQIKQELVIPLFIPPRSPHSLIEEDLYHDPWALLVATIFLNKTCCKTARPYIFWFLDENPDPFTVLSKSPEQLETYFGALGLQKTRALQVWRMSHDFIYKKWKKVSELYGIGRYGEDAFRMFCLGDFSFEPKDRFLNIYKAWYKMNEEEERSKKINVHK